MFFLPNRQARFCLVNDVAAGLERGTAVFGRDSDPHREIPDLQVTHPMNRGRTRQRESLPRFRENPVAFGFCEQRVRLVFKREHRLAFIPISNPAFKCQARTGPRIGQ